jgi:hypothetical protein
MALQYDLALCASLPAVPKEKPFEIPIQEQDKFFSSFIFCKVELKKEACPQKQAS